MTEDDLEPITNSADFRCVISRDGSAWVGRTYGTYMPEEGAEVRSSSLEGLKDQAQGQAWACPKAAGGHLSSSIWSYEYALGEGTDGKLEAFRQARMALWQAQVDREERGQQAAADLATGHNATLPEIADILGVCCSAAAAELLDYKGVQVMAFRTCPHREERTTKERIASKVGWWARISLISPGTSCALMSPWRSCKGSGNACGSAGRRAVSSPAKLAAPLLPDSHSAMPIAAVHLGP